MNFVMVLIFVLIFMLWLGWLLGGGWVWGWGGLIFWIMLVVVLLISFMVLIVWIIWFLMLEVLGSNYICIVCVKGLFECKVILCYGLKFVLLLVISYLGLVFVMMIIGLVVVDMYFLIGGIGCSFVDLVLNCDYVVMMGIIIFVGVLMIFFNFVVDVFYVWIDLKIRY